jgi:hypothetical protein
MELTKEILERFKEINKTQSLLGKNEFAED